MFQNDDWYVHRRGAHVAVWYPLVLLSHLQLCGSVLNVLKRLL